MEIKIATGRKEDILERIKKVCEFESRSWQGVLDKTLCDKICWWLAVGRWFSPGTPVSPIKPITHYGRYGLENEARLLCLTSIIFIYCQIRKTYALHHGKYCTHLYKSDCVYTLYHVYIVLLTGHTTLSKVFLFKERKKKSHLKYEF